VKLLKAYRNDGTTRCIYDDRLAPTLRSSDVHRASHVEPVREGPHRGNWHVDLSPLGELLGRDEFHVCLVTTFPKRADALAAEVAWLERNWILERRWLES